MKTVLVYDSQVAPACKIHDILAVICREQKMAVVSADASAGNFNPCIGCFKCWTRTPGVCIHTGDSGPGFLSQVFDADQIIFISSITCGGYSTKIKFMADRMLPLLHPYFRKLNGEMHHKHRYEKLPFILAVGFGARNEAEEQTFREYTDAHRNNMNSTVSTATYIWNESVTSKTLGDWFLGEVEK